MTTTLTERYIAATVKSLPPAAQADVRAELTASIADAIEARLEQGATHTDAERTVLTDLGDPAILAAGYADRKLQLIGPRYYLTWLRLLKLLLIIVPVCAVGGVALGQALAAAPIGTIIGQAITVGISVVVHLCFWVTIVFVVLERTGADTGTRWHVDQLPEPAPSTGRTDLIAAFVLTGLFAGAILWDQLFGFVRVDDETLPLLNPGLWPWAIAGLLVLIGLEAVLAVVLYVRGRWGIGIAVANTVLALLFAAWAMLLFSRQELVNPEFLHVVFTQNNVDADTLRILAVLLGFGIVGCAAWDIIDGWLKTRRHTRRVAP